MTAITFDGPGGGRYRLRAKGHATGSSEVCAAVSALVYALGGYLLALERSDGALESALRLDSGDAEIEAAGGEAVRAAFHMAEAGLRQLARKYPELVGVDEAIFDPLELL